MFNWAINWVCFKSDSYFCVARAPVIRMRFLFSLARHRKEELKLKLVSLLPWKLFDVLSISPFSSYSLVIDAGRRWSPHISCMRSNENDRCSRRYLKTVNFIRSMVAVRYSYDIFAASKRFFSAPVRFIQFHFAPAIYILRVMRIGCIHTAAPAPSHMMWMK